MAASSRNNKRTTIIVEEEGASPEQVQKIVNEVGVRLTQNELYLLRKKLNAHGTSAQMQFEKYGQDALKRKTTREICLNAVANTENPIDKWGVRVISLFDHAGTSLFAIAATQVAGEVSMNLVGCCLVGCVAALGSGSVNAVLYGAASLLLGQPGVRWVANASYMIVAMVSSVLTFFCLALLLRGASQSSPSRECYGQAKFGSRDCELSCRLGRGLRCAASSGFDKNPLLRPMHERHHDKDVKS